FTYSPSNPSIQVLVSFAGSSSGGVSPYSFNWNFGDGSSAIGANVVHSYSSPGSYSVALTVTDSVGSISHSTASVTVQPPPPPVVTVNTPAPDPASTDATVNLNFAVSSSTSITGITVNWGDGTPLDSLAGTATSDSHIYTTTGSSPSKVYTITVTATDNSGSTGQVLVSVTVNDRPPITSVTGVSPNPALAGQPVSVSFSTSDPDGTVSSIIVNWGDGSPSDSLAGTAASDTHTYASGGNFIISVTATDNSGSSSTGTITESVNAPLAPAVTISDVSPNPASTGQAVTVTFTVSSTTSVSGVTVNWGDGTTDSLAGTATSDAHAYPVSGNFTITIVATDNSGSISQTTRLESVKSASTTPYALAVTADGKVYKTYANGTMTFIGQPVTTQLRQVSWKPDGSYALISGDSAVLLKYDGTQLTSISTGVSSSYNFWTVSWKADGSYALIGGTSGLLLKYNGVSVTTISGPN